MSLLTSHSNHDNEGSDEKAALPLRDQKRETKSSFGSYTDSDILVWLKGLAMDPGDRKASPGSARQLWNQSLELRKLLLLGNDVCPRSKRKLDQFLKGSRFAGASVLATKKSDDHSVKRICRGHSVSCLANTNGKNETFGPQLFCNSHMSGSSLTNEDEYHGNPGCPNLTILDDMEIYRAPAPCKDYSASPLIDTDESVYGSSTLSPENSNFYNITTVKANDSVDNNPDSLSLDEYDSELERALRSLILSDDHLPRSISSAHSTASSRSENRNLKARKILTLLFSDGKYFRRSVPIGPVFQADVPEWIGQVNRDKLYGAKVSKWLGTRMWPIKGGKCGGATVKTTGKGRPEFCSCVSPGSVDCVKHHIHEARLCLQSQIGPAFWSWKFDEMGEFASKSWTLKEQRTFESLVRTNPLSNEASFWKLAFKRFPDKCKKSVVSYYYNVFIPRRMSLETRSSLDEIDSDDDLIEV